MNGQEYARGLRAIANWYEAHPDMPIPQEKISVTRVKETKEEATRIIEALKPCQKEWDSDFFRLTRDFDGLRFEVIFMRSAVCTRRVIGHRVVPAQEERIVEVVEWDCEPALLAKPEEESVAQ